MLKIKDNVDLKELEKFGYELEEDWWNRPKKIEVGVGIIGYEIYNKNVAPFTSIEIEVETRLIMQRYEDILEDVEEKYIKDLIQAGLVEKVEDKMNKSLFKIGDNVKVKLDKVIDEFKHYTGVYKIIDVKQLPNGKFYYELNGVSVYGTDDTIEKVEHD